MFVWDSVYHDIHTDVRTHVRTHVRMCTYVNMCTEKYTCTYVHMRAEKLCNCLITHTLRRARTRTDKCTRPPLHFNAYAMANIHACMNTGIHTRMLTVVLYVCTTYTYTHSFLSFFLSWVANTPLGAQQWCQGQSLLVSMSKVYL